MATYYERKFVRKPVLANLGTRIFKNFSLVRTVVVLPVETKASLTLNDLHDTICITHNWVSVFYCVCTFIQVAHSEFIKVVCTENSAFKSLKIMSQERAVSAVIIALIFEKKKSSKKRQQRKVSMTPWLERRKNLRFYETLLAELRLEDECLRITSENFEEIF